MTRARVMLCGVELKNPFMTASGTFGFGREYNELYPVSVLGAVCTKGLTLLPRDGNPTPRIAETPSGILNAVGLQNPGVERFIDEDLAWLKKQTKVVVNIAGNTVEEYCLMAKKLDGRADFIELNISCPNVKKGGVAFGIYPESVENITKEVKKQCNNTPLMVKLSPNAASIRENALAAERGGADCISLINTITGMAIDIRTKRPVLANVTGGLSGPAVKPVALRMVYEAYNAVSIPIVGIGGIMNHTDTVEFMLAGASAVQVGSANIFNPGCMPEVVEDFYRYLEKEDISAEALTGGLIV